MSAQLAAIRDRYSDIYVIVSPPRCSSTPFARVFWEQPSVGFYSHEPFEVVYFDDAPLDDVVAKLENPLPLRDIKLVPSTGTALVIKEMPYQVGPFFPDLASLTEHPVAFLMKDPRQSIWDRMDMKRVAGDDQIFPLVETGWVLVQEQFEYCRAEGIDHFIVDATDFRNCPEVVFGQVFSRYALPFSPDMLSWQSRDDLDLDNLGGRHTHLYRQVLKSTGLQADDEPTPPIDWFPEAGGFRAHVAECLSIYDSLCASPERIRATATTETGALLP